VAVDFGHETRNVAIMILVRIPDDSHTTGFRNRQRIMKVEAKRIEDS
jgi:hypothetical protein